MAGERRVPLRALLPASHDRQFNFVWPLAIVARLEELVDRANALGARTTRKELLAALVLATEPDGASLDAIVRRYRVATVSDALVDEQVDPRNEYVEFSSRRPGPRSPN